MVSRPVVVTAKKRIERYAASLFFVNWNTMRKNEKAASILKKKEKR